MAADPGGSERYDDLDTKIMRGSAWGVLGYGGTQALSLVSMLALARLLVPEDFGVVALALAVLAIAQIAQESGLGASLIVYKGDLRRAAACVAVFSPLVALGLYALFFVTAPAFARFFDQPDLTAVLRVMALGLVFRGLAVMPLALLERELRFGPISAAELSGGVSQAVTAIALAAAGAGVWSLVLGQLASGLSIAVVAWALSPLRPSPREAERATLSELARFGRHVGVANLINYANANSQGIVVGRSLGSTALGYYSIAGRLAYMPVNVVGNILGRGMFAAMARVRHEPDRFRQLWLENLQRLALLSVPAALGIALVAEPLVLTLLGSAWTASIVPLQLLALRGLVGTFSATSGEVFQALHRPKLRVLAESTYLVVIVPALVVGARWDGIDGAAAATLLVSATFGVVILASMMRLLDVGVGDLAGAVARPAVGWVLMTLVIIGLRPMVDDLSPAAQLVVLIVAGTGVYALSIAAVARDIVTTMWTSLRGARSSG